MGLLAASVSTNANTPLYGSPLPLLFGIVLGGLPLILTFSRRFAVLQVDDEGLRLRSGKVFRWSDLRGIQKVQVTRKGQPLRVDYVLGFRGGGVSIRANEYEDTAALWKYLEHVEQHTPRV